MSVSVLRKWDDVGAPTLWADAFGNIPRLLKTVLVDGYGAFDPLGWTLEDTSSDGNSMIFRNDPNTGTGKYFEIGQSDTGGGVQPYRAAVAVSESYADFGVSLGRMPLYGQYIFFVVGNDGGTSCPDGIHWMIIGDERAFWFLTRPYLSNNSDISTNGKMWYVHFVGDYIPLDISNRSNVFLAGRSVTDDYGGFGHLSYITSTNSNYWVMRDSTFQSGPQQAGLNSGSDYFGQYFGGEVECMPDNTGLHFAVPSIHSVNQKVLGFLPGLFMPMRASGNRGNADNFLVDEVINLPDRTLYVLRFRRYSEAYNMLHSICLSVGEGFRDVF